MEFTDQQKLAIRARNENLLLSAAAGSGKTSVLVERVLGLVREGADIDRMLVVTFTRAAAADMRLKLTRAFTDLAAKGDVRAHEQLLKLSNASISTLHVFCSELLRANFESAGIDPAFRVLDDVEDSRLFARAMDEAMENAYETMSGDLSLLDFGRGPKKVRPLAEKLYACAMERPDPEEWLKKACDAENRPEQLWIDEILRAALRQIDSARVAMRQALAIPTCPERYIQPFQKELAHLDRMSELHEYTLLRDELLAMEVQRLPRAKPHEDDGNEEAVKAARKYRDMAHDQLDAIRLKTLPLEQLKKDTLAIYPALRALSVIVLDAWTRHRAAKEEQAGLTFSDLERFSYIALQNEEVAKNVREQYDYVFVDEYQDVSEMQEMLIRRVSRGDNLFLVGDVKQSIYRFRLAEPTLFLDRAKEYASGNGGRLLPLTMNFRSRAEILDLVNAVFEKVMIGGETEVVYDKNARLNPGRAPAEDPILPEMYLIERTPGQRNADGEDMSSAAVEGRLIAGRIVQMMREDPALSYRDIAVITRTKSANEAILSALAEANIPAYAEGTTGYFDTLEISFALSLMRLVANRRSDVELIGALRSPMVALSNDELARIRIAYPDCAYVDAVEQYAREKSDSVSESLREFLHTMDDIRLCMGAMGLGDLVRLLLDKSGFYLYCGALPGGAQRRANLDRLVADATVFDNSRSGSIVRFLKHAEFLKQTGSGEDAQLLGENDNVVRLMTIHKSKGLEFPVVFAPLLSRTYRSPRMDVRLVTDGKLGVGIRLNDPDLHTVRTTLPMESIEAKMQREDRAEEMRLLYVLLTRAKEKLVLIGSVSNAANVFARAIVSADLPNAADSHLQLIAAGVLSRPDWKKYLSCTVLSADSVESPAAAGETVDVLDLARRVLGGEEIETDEKLEKMLTWEYPDPEATKRPLKLTASGLLRQLEGPQELPDLVERPQFMTEKGLTGAERGTAYHQAMQIFDLSRFRGKSLPEVETDARVQLLKAKNANRMSEQAYQAIDVRRIANFYLSPIGQRLLASPMVQREWSFNVMMRIAEAVPEYADHAYANDEILVQGTLDCCFEEGGEWVLLDYKTDRTTDDEALRARYKNQLTIYALALERITGCRVKDVILCMIGRGDTISLLKEENA